MVQYILNCEKKVRQVYVMQSVKSDKLKKILQRILSDIKKNGLAIIIVAVGLFVVNYIFGTICPIAILFGVPCPGCGMTRAVMAVLHGQFMQAAHYNAAVYLWAAYAVFWAIDRYFFENKKKMISVTAIIVVCILTIVYFIYRIFTGTLVSVSAKGIINMLIE